MNYKKPESLLPQALLQLLLQPMSRATEALVRLDERLSRSDISEGLLSRLDFADAIASLWVDGELAHMEDLVFHDARMDVRSPSPELVLAHLVLRARREIASAPADWPFTAAGLARLRGRGVNDETHTPKPSSLSKLAPDDDFDEALAAFDAALAKATTALEVARTSTSAKAERHPLLYDLDWDEDARLQKWQAVVGEVESLPSVLGAAIMLDAWQTIAVSEHSPWLGRQLAAAYLRERRTALHHLPTLNVGLRLIARERRHSRDRSERLIAILEAIELGAGQGLKEHDRLVLARAALERRLQDKRDSSRLPALVQLVLSRPMVSAAMAARELSVTQQGALRLIKQLQLRELTGRGRFRAWGIL
ncbi:RHE_PE00001 family protein [Allorhizobium undicola]|uniref:RHE_PE00001 family protein n=1 Tax=Allorhizobium undicola TaxID=78527 RepID=UPI0006850B5C|nr:RHE_PE00001 family protein [Allorhizobium undicola]